jgi:CBS domain containing-hemolysin-like protein
VGIFSGLLAFLILVVSEIIPKTLGAIYWRRLGGWVGTTLDAMTRAMFPALLLSRLLTRLLTRGSTLPYSRGELAATIATAAEAGAISAGESKIFENLLRFDQVRVEDVMTPRTVAVVLASNLTVTELLGSRQAESFSRIPLYEGGPDNIVGYVLQREVLKYLADGSSPDEPLAGLMRPITFIPEVATVGAALRHVLERREPIAMAIDEHGGISGLVTLEDLTETILGVEIVDESDRVIDLRQSAVALRDQRMRSTQRRLESKRGRGSPINRIP